MLIQDYQIEKSQVKMKYNFVLLSVQQLQFDQTGLLLISVFGYYDMRLIA